MDLDEVGKGILYPLQRDAREITTRGMADQVGVSASTVRNRITQMEEYGIIRGYYPDIDYDQAGLQLYVEIICSAPNPRREQLADQAREISGIISIREVCNGQDNIQIDAVETDSDDVARITGELSELGVEVVNTKIVKNTVIQPFNHFGEHVVEGDRSE